VAVENASLYESARREAESATQLLEFGRELASASSLEDILERIVGSTATLIDSPRTSVWIEDDDGWLVPRKLHGHSDEERAGVEGRRFHVASVRKGLGASPDPFVLGPDQYRQFDNDPPDPEASYAIAPFGVGRRVGCIIATVPDTDFGERELRLLGGLAHQAQLAIANASNYEGLEQTFVSTVEALANALEANDEYTSMHARWITDLALRVGDEFDLDKRGLKRLELGALLHDIGKIGIPSDILAKPGRLNAEERALIERHPELGERIIAPIDRLQEVRTIVRHCHERWDGGGYPDRISGEDIPLESRIVFVCDAYHAMTTDRPYRKRLSHPEAVRRLRDGAGSQFDARVVEVCVSVLSDLRR
jgi:HD-GYP domain-containing protein (c-di-GMP phosphodiesterase class II)